MALTLLHVYFTILKLVLHYNLHLHKYIRIAAPIHSDDTRALIKSAVVILFLQIVMTGNQILLVLWLKFHAMGFSGMQNLAIHTYTGIYAQTVMESWI